MKRIDPESRYGRVAGRLDVEALAPKRFTAIGLGSMGQPITTQLVRHGVASRSPGRLRLIDGKDVSERNLIGTEYRPGHVGTPKAQAAASIVREIDEDLNVSFWERTLTKDDIPAVVNMAGQSDLLGLFADSFDLMMEIADRCSGICPQVMAVFGPNADYAEVAFSVPGQTAAIPQVMGRRHRQTIAKPTAIGCDTIFVASFVAAVCLRLLLGDAKGAELVPCYTNAPLFILGLRRSWIFANQPADVARSIVLVRA